MIRLLLVASAPTAATRRAAFPTDEAIDERGAADASALRGTMRTPDIALTGPALRARQTATAIGLANATTDAALADLDYGSWTGATPAEIDQRDPQGLARWMADPEAAPHGGESIAALFERTRALMARLTTDSGWVTAVTHAAVMRAAVVAALDAPLAAFWRIDIAPLTRVTLHADGARWRLRAIENSTAPKPDRA